MPHSPTDRATVDGVVVDGDTRAPGGAVAVGAIRDATLRWLYVVGGLIGLTAAFVLLVEKIALIEDPSYVPSCSINPVLSCGSIMKTDQSAVFGFPNPLLGVAGFAVVVTVGMAMLASAAFRAWFWNGLLAGCVAGAVFVHWLIFQSLYRIDALCPYCMAVWAVTIPIFWYTALRVVCAPVAAKQGVLSRPASVLLGYHGVILTAWYLTVGALILQRFWEYWETLLP